MANGEASEGSRGRPESGAQLAEQDNGAQLSEPARPVERVKIGARQVLRAAKLLSSDRALLRAALLPTVLTTLGCVLFAWLSASDHDADEGTALQAFIGAFLTLSAMPPTVLQRQWMRVGLVARTAVGTTPGELERPNERYLGMLWRETLKAMRQAVAVAIGLGPLLVLLHLLPYSAYTVAGVSAAWAGYWTIVDAFEIPMELVPGKQGELPPSWFERGFLKLASWRIPFFGWGARFAGWIAKPWRHEVRFTERHPWETLGFGLTAGLFLLIPGVGLFFRAIAISGATSLIAHCKESEAALTPSG